jgi:hypothetical protein
VTGLAITSLIGDLVPLAKAAFQGLMSPDQLSAALAKAHDKAQAALGVAKAAVASIAEADKAADAAAAALPHATPASTPAAPAPGGPTR